MADEVTSTAKNNPLDDKGQANAEESDTRTTSNARPSKGALDFDPTFRPSTVSSSQRHLTVHELEPIQTLYLDKHQTVAVISLGMGALLLLTAGFFLIDWHKQQRECHFDMISLDPDDRAIIWGFTHECRFAVELDEWIITASLGISIGFAQILTFGLAVYAKWETWCKINVLYVVLLLVTIILAVVSKVYNIPLPPVNARFVMLQVRGTVFFAALILDLVFLPLATFLVFFWALLYRSS